MILKLFAVADAVAGVVLLVIGIGAGLPVLILVGGILLVVGVGLFVIDRMIAPLMRTSREITEKSGMKVGRLTGAPTMRSAARHAAEQTARGKASMAAITGDAALRAKGVPGRAAIKAARDTGEKQNMNPIFEIDLIVTPDNARAYDLTVHTEVNTLAVAQCVPGTTVAVKVDPDDQSKLWIDWLAVAGGGVPSAGSL